MKKIIIATLLLAGIASADVIFSQNSFSDDLTDGGWFDDTYSSGRADPDGYSALRMGVPGGNAEKAAKAFRNIGTLTDGEKYYIEFDVRMSDRDPTDWSNLASESISLTYKFTVGTANVSEAVWAISVDDETSLTKWTHVRQEFTKSGTLSDVELRFFSKSTTTKDPIWVDNIAFATVPEPATLGLVMAFGTGILFIRRKLMM
jgi:hypothetical protein